MKLARHVVPFALSSVAASIAIIAAVGAGRVAYAAEVISAVAPSTGLDGASSEALEKTQALLNSRALREKAIQNDPSAKSADAQAHALEANGVSGDAVYGLSSEIFADLVKQTGGDPIKLQEIIYQAQKDPEGFAKKMSDKNQRAIRELSGKAVVAPNPPK